MFVCAVQRPIRRRLQGMFSDSAFHIGLIVERTVRRVRPFLYFESVTWVTGSCVRNFTGHAYTGNEGLYSRVSCSEDSVTIHYYDTAGCVGGTNSTTFERGECLDIITCSNGATSQSNGYAILVVVVALLATFAS